ncbi:DUF4491 family protein [Aminipila butyrica]|uniref:DUF4491 family protein n=1 Tax=Aminipila butyrica TaxID=433296 RepID=A0A858BTI3_9FIRM|nr:DUF4491 family protein [Aminipila butyrica]QIB69243.1 DUF4491 family protein [Aminipila butyrica]
MNYLGMCVGIGTFIIIGVLHPVVIKSEYYLGTKIWPLFLIAGLACIVLSLFLDHLAIAALLSVLGFSLLWSIKELFEQEQRVKKGWFPSNPRKNKKA